MKKNIIIISILVVLIGVVGFFAGMQYQKMQPVTFGRGGNQNPRGQFTRRTEAGGGVVAGEIVSKDDKSITVKMQDGSSKIIILSGKTAINKQTKGSADELKTGDRVAVFGAQNSDGSVTAQTISLGGMFRASFGAEPSPTQ